MRRLILTILVLCPLIGFSQEYYSFPFGKPTFNDFDLKVYPSDTSAAAYVIKELAEAHVDYETNNKIIFTYHVKIRILRKEALGQANVEVLLRKTDDRKEEIRDVVASSFLQVNSQFPESKLSSKDVFMEKNGKYYDVAKFAIPNVQVGSVIEYMYTIVSPYLYNFRGWQFQSDLPKLHSEYWTVIPANYVYNVSLRGSLQLADRKSEIVKECISSGNGSVAECVRNKYVMKNIPAFKEEDFMTAKGNFLSAINFELSEVKHWDGRVDKIAKEWKDADLELKLHQNFGVQIRKAKDVVSNAVDAATAGVSDPLAKAKKVYDMVKFRYSWDGTYGFLSESIKRAFDEKKGDVGDINLTLLAALRYAGLNADPVLLATRNIERPTELYPVLSDFNYVIIRLTIGDKAYLLDATDDYYPFGTIPRRCYNGKGRLIADLGSSWLEIKPTDRERKMVQMNLKLGDDGNITGTIQELYYGYAAIDKRLELSEYKSKEEYLEKLKAQTHDFTISNYEQTVDNEDLTKPIVEKYNVEWSGFDSPQSAHLLFNPILIERVEKNPFKTEERMFPVDYGTPYDLNVTLTMELPANVEVTSVPDRVAIALPASGGRYLYMAQVEPNKLSVSNILSIAKPLYQPEEYPYLRELYSKMIQTQATDIVIQRKK